MTTWATSLPRLHTQNNQTAGSTHQSGTASQTPLCWVNRDSIPLFDTHTRTHPCSRYTFTKTIPGSSTTVQFVFIDTVVLAGLHIPGVTVGQPKMPDSAAWRQKAQDQWTWVNQTLQASTADWLIVAGHYPVWSIAEVQSVMGSAVLGSCAACEGARAHALGLDLCVSSLQHGPTWILVEWLKPMLEANKVAFYLNGHDHNLQYLNDGSGIAYIDCGAGEKRNGRSAATLRHTVTLLCLGMVVPSLPLSLSLSTLYFQAMTMTNPTPMLHLCHPTRPSSSTAR